MRAPPLYRLSITVATIVALSSPSVLEAQTPLTPGTWSLFEWFAGVGPVDGNGFLLNATQRTRVRVTDDGVTGDAFDIFLNGVFLLGTPSVPDGVFTGALDGDAAWADPGLSKIDFFLLPGQYTITLAVRQTASGFDYGEGFLRADDAPLPPVSTVPEPATVGLFAAGLFGIGVARWRTARARRV
jgi:hypothetical protein